MHVKEIYQKYDEQLRAATQPDRNGMMAVDVTFNRNNA